MTSVMLPQLSLSMETGKLIRWLVTDGAVVHTGQAIAEIETDKAIGEIEAPVDGTIRLLAAEGADVAVDTALAEIEDSKAAPAPEDQTTRQHRASPAARRIAHERGLDLTQTQGSGEYGRITTRDLPIERSTQTTSLRDSVVDQLTRSWQSIPHIQIGGELEGAGLAAAKLAAPEGVSVTDLLVFTLARALVGVPELNAVNGKAVSSIHVALAVATPGGVIAPVIRHANERTLIEISRERARLVADARKGSTDRRDLAGGTVTLTNLGAWPVDFFAPIVSGPQAAMIAAGRLAEKPVARGGLLGVAHRIWMNVAIDHRVADGIAGARLLTALEQGMRELPSANP